MPMKLKPVKSNQPVYTKAYESIREAIEGGGLSAGQKLPSETKLAQDLNISRDSLRRALDQLELEGYIERKRGLGTFVIDRYTTHVEAGIEKLVSMSQVIRSRGHEPGTREIEVLTELADENMARQLNIKEGDPITVVNRIRTIDGKPIFWDTNRYPYDLFPASTQPEDIGESLFHYTEHVLGLDVSHSVARLIPAQADEALAEKLEIEPGSLLINLVQMHYMGDDTPVWHSSLFYPESEFRWFIVRTR